MSAPQKFYTFSPKTTTISNVSLSPAQGDLQRILSAFFSRPISLALIYSHTFTKRSDDTLEPLSLPNPNAIASASPEFPIVQNRQVHLQCSGKVVCTATSTVKISSSLCAHLFLEEKYGIGQLFSKLGATPSFELLGVGIGGHNDVITVEKGFGGGPQLWRKYRLSVPEIECEILEVFASREMFLRGESWLDGRDQPITSSSLTSRRSTTNTLLWFAFLSMLMFELYMYIAGPSRCI
ncbi:hypothetical protein MVEN_00994900 [Mycena venus]|uniref:Uncharacterized protein n=1 Tax=Mycena venus TaxID=2733690 RepID=A0A8H7D2R5_9AGAR|nr:hypothetical protein MVEN_00994900 [Mycena venus]